MLCQRAGKAKQRPSQRSDAAIILKERVLMSVASIIRESKKSSKHTQNNLANAFSIDKKTTFNSAAMQKSAETVLYFLFLYIGFINFFPIPII